MNAAHNETVQQFGDGAGQEQLFGVLSCFKEHIPQPEDRYHSVGSTDLLHTGLPCVSVQLSDPDEGE